MEKEGQEKKVVAENTPAAGVNATSAQVPFSYEDVARLVIKNRDKYDPVVIYYNTENGDLFAGPTGLHANYVLELFKWSATDDETALEDEDLTLADMNASYDYYLEEYLNDHAEGYWDSFAEYLQAHGEYNHRVKLYLMRKMRRENPVANWATQIEEAKKSE